MLLSARPVFGDAHEGDALSFAVYDKDWHKGDDLLGKVTLTGDQAGEPLDNERGLLLRFSSFLLVYIGPSVNQLLRSPIEGPCRSSRRFWGLNGSRQCNITWPLVCVRARGALPSLAVA